MEIIQRAVAIKLSKEEREHLTATLDLLQQMESYMPCGDNGCPFKERCDQKNNIDCLLREVKKDLIYINEKCD